MFELLFGFFITFYKLLSFLAFVWMLYDLFTYNKDLNPWHKVIWVLLSLPCGLFAICLYYVIGRK